MGRGFALAQEVRDANVKVVGRLALVEKVVLDDADGEGLVLLLEVSGNFTATPASSLRPAPPKIP